MVAVFQLEERLSIRAHQLGKLAKIDGLGMEGRIIPEKVKFVHIQEDGMADFITSDSEEKVSSPVSVPFKYLEMDDNEFHEFYFNMVNK